MVHTEGQGQEDIRDSTIQPAGDGPRFSDFEVHLSSLVESSCGRFSIKKFVP
jgi:hypothetical protein